MAVRRLVFASGGLLLSMAVVSAGGATVSAAPRPPLVPAVNNGSPAGGKVAAPNKKTSAKKKRYYVAQGPRFNWPTGNTAQQGAIDLYVKKLIRNTPKGAEINVSLFRLQTEGMAKELVAAHRRGAKVRLVLDSNTLSARRYVYDYLKRNLGASTKNRSWVLLCPKGRGCIAPKWKGQWSKNHNKFYSFSHTYDSRNVVVQTSGNATGGMYNQYNDSYTSTDARIYGAYRKYFYDLAKRKADGNYWRTYNAGFRKTSFFPKATGDPIVDVLNRVSCSGGRTWVSITMGILAREQIAKKLAALDDQGCHVKVVGGQFGSSAVGELTRPGRNKGPEVRYFTGAQKQHAHSKYLLIDGLYSGKRHRLVLTGSHSYTWDALRWNDEAMITIDHAWTYGRYLSNFNLVFAAAKGRFTMSPLIAPPTVGDNTPDNDDAKGPAAPPAEVNPAPGEGGGEPPAADVRPPADGQPPVVTEEPAPGA
ncbi:phospholipase D-like domain-containing protein [Spirillospora sp. NPDC127200]